MAEAPAAADSTNAAAADTSNVPPTIAFFRKMLRSGHLALRQFAAWRKAEELLATGTAKSIRASRRYQSV